MNAFRYDGQRAERERREIEQRRRLWAELICEREGLRKEPARIERLMQQAEMEERR